MPGHWPPGAPASRLHRQNLMISKGKIRAVQARRQLAQSSPGGGAGPEKGVLWGRGGLGCLTEETWGWAQGSPLLSCSPLCLGHQPRGLEREPNLSPPAQPLPLPSQVNESSLISLLYLRGCHVPPEAHMEFGTSEVVGNTRKL